MSANWHENCRYGQKWSCSWQQYGVAKDLPLQSLELGTWLEQRYAHEFINSDWIRMWRNDFQVFVRKFHIIVLDSKLKYGLTWASTLSVDDDNDHDDDDITTVELIVWRSIFHILDMLLLRRKSDFLQGTVDIDVDVFIIDDGEAECRHWHRRHKSRKSANPLFTLNCRQTPPCDLCTWAKF